VKVAIVGSRDYPRLDLVREFVRRLLPGTVVISGGAASVDNTAIDEADKMGLDTTVFPANWALHGKAAGPMRNTLIVNACDELVAFWDGHSRGTKDSIDKAKAAHKQVYVY